MTLAAFDTLDYSNKLKEAGFTEKQAEIQAHGIANIINSNLCTKTDLKELELSLKKEIVSIREEISFIRKDMDKIYWFILKAVTTPIVVIGVLQTYFNFYK